MIEIRTLGPAAVTVDGGPPPPEILWRKHLGLLVYLARSPRGRTRDHLLGLLWQDKPGPAARHSLNEALRVIRRTAGDEVVVTTVDQVTLVGGVQLDVDQLERALAEDRLADAESLAGGEFLEGFAVPGESGFENWLAAEQRHWRDRCVDLLARRAAALMAAGDHTAAARAAERATRLDPASEKAARAAIEAAARSGDSAGAAAHFRRFQSDLALATGGQASGELRQLVDRIGRGGGRTRKAPDPADIPDRRRAPLAGRHAALGDLAAWWTIVQSGRAAVVTIIGDSGLGKSRLIDEIRHQVIIDGGTTVVARMVEADRERVGAALVTLGRGGLIDAPGAAGASPAAIGALAGAAPEWADRFPAAAPSSLPLAAAIGDILDSSTREAPVILAVDDAQWIDPDSMATLEGLLRDLAARPFGLIVSAGPYPPREELDRLRSRIGGDVSGRAIGLGPLTAPEVRSLAAWAFADYEPDALDRLCRRLMLETAGYPLFVIELLGAIAAGADLGDASPWLRPDATLSQTLPGELPDSIVAAIRVSFRRLSPDAQIAAACAAIGPVRIDPDRLGIVAGLDPARLGPALDQLEWARWFAPDPVGYTFVARIVRQVVERDFVTTRQRRQWTAGWAGSA